jgi:hypothetical protein
MLEFDETGATGAGEGTSTSFPKVVEAETVKGRGVQVGTNAFSGVEVIVAG